MGRSNPIISRSLATFSGFAFSPSRVTATSPGRTRIKVKVTIDTTINTGIVEINR